MNKKIAIVALMSLSAGVALSGCQNLQDQMGAKLAEGIINSSTNGEVKVNFDDLKNGKMTVQTKEGTIQMTGDETDGGGSIKMTDASGKTTTYEGNAGGSRPADVPADMPTLDNGTDFGYFNYNGMVSVTFKVADKEFKAVCQKEMAAVESAGWKVDSEGMALEASDTILKAYVKGNENLALTCGLNDGETTIGLQKNVLAS